jgi:hypothetical protein
MQLSHHPNARARRAAQLHLQNASATDFGFRKSMTPAEEEAAIARLDRWSSRR